MVSEKKKISNRKWDKEHIRTVSCRLRTEDAERFKKFCNEQGTTPSQYLKKCAMDTINSNGAAK